MTTARALPGRFIGGLIYQMYTSSEHTSDRALEALYVAPHDGLRGLGIAGLDRLEELAVLLDRVSEACDSIEHEEPDPKSQHVVLLERRLEERIVGARIDLSMDALVEIDERALV